MLDEVQSVSRSERIVLECPVVGGDPPPSIVWTKHGSEISLGERIHQLSNGSLVIYDVTVGTSVSSVVEYRAHTEYPLCLSDVCQLSFPLQSEDGGDYRCVATNDAGSSEGVAHVNVKSKRIF